MTQISETHKVDMNGVVDTNRTVMQNIENIANSSYAWVTYDITTGKWSVVINQAGTSVKSFTSDNIVGAVDLSITPLDRLYNAVEIQFPDRTLDDANRMVKAEMLAADLKQNEQENVLRLTYPLINDQIRALTLGLTELKQSRLDKVVSFVTNFTANGLRAGDIVDITLDTYSWTNKLFRVLEVAEVDTDAGDFNLRVTCIEYSDTVYEHDTEKFTLSNDDGIFSLGNILPMNPIQVTLTELDQLPFVEIESIFSSAGAPVTGVEIWAYNVTDPAEIADWNNPLIYSDDERAYSLLTTKHSVDESYAYSDTFVHKIYDISDGNWLFKIRPVNALTQGPFTTPGALTTYLPKVGVGAADDVFDTILSSIGNLPLQPLNVTNFYLNLPTDTTTPAPGNVPTPRLMQSSTFTCTRSGNYNVNFLFEQSSSGALGGRGGLGYSEARDYIDVALEIIDLSSSTSLGGAASGGDGVFYWTDLIGSKSVALVDTVSYRIDFYYRAYTGLAPGTTMDGTVNLTVSLAV
jgi:hypothetical protein